ncbi:MAG: hypothetical protein HC827_04275 [Cyanobacteria bacterium RM1_2_2]|nr:hypothetical protein [Cyanobacteria bacterium RM1_2_2]
MDDSSTEIQGSRLNVPLEKVSASQIAAATLRAIEQGIEDVIPDSVAQQVLGEIQPSLKALEKQFAGMLPQAV